MDYEVLYTDTVRATLLQYDTTRPYLPSSPSNGVVEEDPYVMRWGYVQDDHWGDVHYYNYDALCTDVSTFPTPRFASEYGFQAFPSLITLSAISQPSDWAPTSPLMVHRQHHTNGTQQLMNQMAVCTPQRYIHGHGHGWYTMATDSLANATPSYRCILRCRKTPTRPSTLMIGST